MTGGVWSLKSLESGVWSHWSLEHVWSPESGGMELLDCFARGGLTAPTDAIIDYLVSNSM